MIRQLRRGMVLAPLVVLAGLMALSCFDDATAPRSVPGLFSLAPRFESEAADIVPVDRFRVLLRRASDNSVALDTVVTITPGADSVDLSLSVPMFTSSETFLLTLSLITPTSDTAFQAGPTAVTPTTGGGGTPPVIPLTVRYVGVGARAASVRIVTVNPSVFFGDTATLAAEALDSTGTVIPGTPIAWGSLDTLRARVPSAAQGKVVGATQRGAARVTATLLTGPADTISVLVQPKPVRAAVESGNNQSGQVATLLAQPVRFRVKAADSLGVSGVKVKFAVASGGGLLDLDSAVTNDSGRVAVQWKLGSGSGVQTLRARVMAAVADSVLTASATALAGPADSLAVNDGDAQAATAGTAVATAPSVVVRDSLSNSVPGVTVTFAVSAGGGNLTGAAPTTDANGIARVGSWTLGTAAGVNALTATVPRGAVASAGMPAEDGGPSPGANAAGDTLTVTFTATGVPGPVATLDVTGIANPATAGLPTDVTVTARDALGNVVTGYPGTVHFTASDPVALLPADYTFPPSDNGTHTFASAVTLLTGGTQSVTATEVGAPTITGTQSVTVQPGAPSPAQSVVTASSPTVPSGSNVALTLQAKDVGGNNVVIGGATVVFTATGGTSTGTISATTDNGDGTYTATFTGATAGTATTIGATIDGNTVTSSLPTVTVTPGGAVTLAFSTPPANTTVSATMAPVVVAARDAAGNTASGFTGSVTLALQSNPPGGTLSGTLSVNAALGLATFNDLSVTTVGSGYTVQATATGLTAATSRAFVITPLGMTHLWVGGTSTDWTTATNWQGGAAPASATDNVFVPASATNQPVIGTDRTVGGLLVENGATLTIGSGITLTADGNVNAGNTIVGPGAIQLTGYGTTFQGAFPNVLIADSVSLSGAASATGNVTVSAAAGSGKLNLNGRALAVSGNFDVVSGFGAQLIMQQADDRLTVAGNVTFNGGSESGLLTNGVIEVSGNFTQQASFSGASYAPSGSHRTRLNGTGKQTLDFSSPSTSWFADLELARSDTITLATAIKAVGQLIAPDTATTVVLGGGQTLDVSGLSAAGLVLDHVLLTSAGGTLARFDNVTLQNYAATATQLTLRHSGLGSPLTFSGVRFLTTPTTGKYLSVTDTLAGPADTLKILMAGSQPINGSALTTVSGGAVVAWPHLAFTVQPSATIAGQTVAPALQVEARDAAGNLDPSFTGTVTLAIGANPQGGTLSGTLSRAAVGGVATFNDISIDNIGTGYTLSASASGYGAFGSATFDITAPAGGIYWVNTSGGNWTNPANWSPATVPASTDNVFIQQNGSYTVTLDVVSPTTVAQLTIGGGNLNLNGRKLTINGPMFLTGGVFTMQAPGNADTLVIKDSLVVTSSSANTGLKAGVIFVGRNFRQAGGATNFAATGSHKVVLNGSTAQTISFANPDSNASRFQNLDVFGFGATKTLGSDVYVTGKLRADSSATITGPYTMTVHDSVITGFAGFGATITPAKVRVGGKLSIGGPTNSFSPDTVEFFRLADTMAVNSSIAYKYVIVSASSVAMQGNATVTGLTVGSSSQLATAGFVLTDSGSVLASGNSVTGTGTVRLVGPANRLVSGRISNLDVAIAQTATAAVKDSAHITRNLTLTRGTFAPNGYRVIVDSTLVFNPGASDTANLNFGSPDGKSGVVRVLGDLDGGFSNMFMSMHEGLDTLHVAGNATFFGSVPDDSALTGGVIVFQGGFDEDGSPGFWADTLGNTTVVLADTTRTVYLASGYFRHVRVTGDTVSFGYSGTVVHGGLTVADGGLFDLGSDSIVVKGSLVTQTGGRLRMNGSGSLNVQGDATFDGAGLSGLLSNGTLRVGGNFTQVENGSVGGTFEATSNHVVELNGSAQQTVHFDSPVSTGGASQFNDLRVVNKSAGGIKFTSQVFIVRNLLTPLDTTTQRLFGQGYTLTARGLNAQYIVFDSLQVSIAYVVPLSSSLSLSNATFQKMNPTATQITIVRDYESATFTNVKFLTVPTTGRYLYLDDVDNLRNSPVLTMVSPTPANHGGFAVTDGFASISGWPF